MGREDKALRVREYRRKGEPFVWLSGGAIALGIVMIFMLVGLVFASGSSTFWPKPIALYTLGSGESFLANVQSSKTLDIRDLPLQEDGTPWERDEFSDGSPTTLLLRLGNKRNPTDKAAGWGEIIGDVPSSDPVWNERNRFEWVKTGIPDLKGYKEGNAKGYQSVILQEQLEGENLVHLRIDTMALGGDEKLVNALRRGTIIGEITSLSGASDQNVDAAHMLEQVYQAKKSTESAQMTFELKPLGADALKIPVEAFQSGHPLRPLDEILLVERLEGGPLMGWLVAVEEKGKTLASIEDEKTASKLQDVFQEQIETAQQVREDRIRVNEVDISNVNHELDEIKDEVKKITYKFRSSRVVDAANSSLSTLYDDWSKRDTSIYSARESMQRKLEAISKNAPGRIRSYKTDIYEEQREEFNAALEQWRAELDKEIKAWTATFDETLKSWSQDGEAVSATSEEFEAIEELKKLYSERGRLRAMEYSSLNVQMNVLMEKEDHYSFVFERLDGGRLRVHTGDVVRANQLNSYSFTETVGVYLSRVFEFLSEEPREAGTEGGIFEIIIGTLLMTVLMSLAVVPFGVVAALYLREYAKQGPLVSAVRISVNNLAGVPSIVFGIFGLGFFCTVMGGQIDDWLYPWKGGPVFGGGGLLWASLTLALLTIPVVVVATEEALASVPSSQREASLGCGASKFQTIWRVILPQSLPGILTGTILAMARGAGEVAPLMLVGVIAYAQDLPIDGDSPFLHLERKFMHLGFHIYNNGFKSPNVDQTKPLVFSTALVLLGLVGFLNVFAIRLRNRLRKRLSTSHV